MKKIFLIAVVLLMMINFIINYQHEVTKEKHTPMADFKTKVEMAPMKEYNDPDFGYVIKYPCFFQQEDTSVSGYQGYARFSFTNHANIILESYVTPNYSNTLQACADSLAQKLHSERTMQASNKGKKLMKKVYFGLADGTFLYGNYAKELMIKEGFDANKLFVIHNSLNYEQQLEFRNELSPSNIYYEHFGNNHPILLFVGRLTKVKRIDLLFESLSLLKRQNKEFNVVLIGSGSEEVYLKRLSLKLGMADSVWFYGACYDEKTNAELIYNADLCVSPGNVGLTAIHTLMFGTPVVTHNDFTMQMPEFESIKDQVTGAFFEYNNAQSLAECIDKWFECNSAKRDVVRKECFEEIDNQWNPNFQMNVLKQYLK